MPSYSEGFGLAMVEAALAKRAIVCSDIPSFHEIFGNDEACFFTLKDIKSLRKAIINAYENRNIMGEMAYRRVYNHFTTQRMAENHLIYYKELFKDINDFIPILNWNMKFSFFFSVRWIFCD